MKVTVYRLNSMFESNQNHLFKGTVPTDIARYKVLDEFDVSDITEVKYNELKSKLEEMKVTLSIINATLGAAKEAIAEYLFNSTNSFFVFGEGEKPKYCMNCGDIVDFDGEPMICDLAGWTSFKWGEEWKKVKEAK